MHPFNARYDRPDYFRSRLGISENLRLTSARAVSCETALDARSTVGHKPFPLAGVFGRFRDFCVTSFTAARFSGQRDTGFSESESWDGTATLPCISGARSF